MFIAAILALLLLTVLVFSDCEIHLECLFPYMNIVSSEQGLISCDHNAKYNHMNTQSEEFIGLHQNFKACTNETLKNAFVQSMQKLDIHWVVIYTGRKSQTEIVGKLFIHNFILSTWHSEQH